MARAQDERVRLRRRCPHVPALLSRAAGHRRAERRRHRVLPSAATTTGPGDTRLRRQHDVRPERRRRATAGHGDPAAWCARRSPARARRPRRAQPVAGRARACRRACRPSRARSTTCGPYLARGTVFACPMRLGSGIKNKILQAWAMARPVVATPASLGGLAAQDDVNLLVREDNEGFCRSRDRTDPRSAAIAQRAWPNEVAKPVEREYAWAHRAAQFEAVLNEARRARWHAAEWSGPRATQAALRSLPGSRTSPRT